MREQVGTIYEQQKTHRLRFDLYRGRSRLAKIHGGPVLGLAGQEHHLRAAREKGRLRQQYAAIYGLAGKAEAEGVRILTGCEVTGFEFGNNSRAVTGIHTNKGPIKCDYVVVGAGPWVNKLWNMLELPRTVSIRGSDGRMHDGVRTWKFWCSRKARSASIRTCTRPMTAACRRSFTSIAMRALFRCGRPAAH